MATQKVMNVLDSPAGLIESWPAGFDFVLPGPQQRSKTVLLGLPCARCRAYYGADVELCTVCGCEERVQIVNPVASVLVM
jgi:hypothetical protein